jgi:serine phosphatase RsbU (regulator of sigma subunit)
MAKRADVLVVDDEPNVLSAVVRALREEFGDAVATTTEPAEALRLLEARRPKVLLTDYHMPGMDGVEVLQRAREVSPDTVRILVTARAELRNVAAAVNTGEIFRFVRKPWDEGELSAAVRDALEFYDATLSRREAFARADAERKTLGAAIEAASAIQRAILPSDEIVVRGGAAACSITPCEHATGDYVDAMVLPDGRTALFVGDVSGHGLGAALFVFTARALLRAGLADGEDLATVLRRANAFLSRDMVGERFMTLFVGLFDERTATLEWVNAGHVPPLVAGGGGLRELRRTAMPLGILAEAPPPKPQALELGRDELLFAYTDGVLEARGPDDEFFGMERLQRLVLAHRGAPPLELLREVRGAVTAFAGTRGLQDDLALLALRVA